MIKNVFALYNVQKVNIATIITKVTQKERKGKTIALKITTYDL